MNLIAFSSLSLSLGGKVYMLGRNAERLKTAAEDVRKRSAAKEDMIQVDKILKLCYLFFNLYFEFVPDDDCGFRVFSIHSQFCERI